MFSILVLLLVNFPDSHRILAKSEHSRLHLKKCSFTWTGNYVATK